MSNEFTDNELRSIAVNAAGRTSEAGGKAVIRIGLAMKNLIKILIPLLFYIQYSNAFDAPNWFLKHKPTECSLSLYMGKSKCVKLVYQEIDERLNITYKNILKYVSEDKTAQLEKEYNLLLKLKNNFCSGHLDFEAKLRCEKIEKMLDKDYKNILANIDAVKLVKKYPSWLGMRDEFCSMYLDNQTKLQVCYIDLGIDKLHEFWDIEWEIDSIPYFEGKWISCNKDYYNNSTSCTLSFFVEQNDKICGAWRNMEVDYIRGIRANFWKEKEDGMAYTGIGCYDGSSGDEVCSVYTVGNESRRLNKEQLDSNVSNWHSFDYNYAISMQYYYDKGFFQKSNIKTPFFPNEKEELIKNNKWLQDCLKQEED